MPGLLRRHLKALRKDAFSIRVLYVVSSNAITSATRYVFGELSTGKGSLRKPISVKQAYNVCQPAVRSSGGAERFDLAHNVIQRVV